MEINCFQNILDIIMISDKAAFVNGALFCVQRFCGNLELSRSNSAFVLAENNLHKYVATNSVSLWDCGIY